MRLTRTFLTLILAVSLVALPAQPVYAAVKVLNVMPLHNQEGRNFCTTWYIGEEKWVTAGHCIAAASTRGWSYGVSGKRGELLFLGFDEQRDVAVIEIKGLKADHPFKMADRAPVRGDMAVVTGYPYGLPVLTTTQGIVAARNVPIGATAPISDILDIAVAGGNSGSPVLDRDGNVIGLLWGAFTQSPHSLSIPLESLRRDIGIYFKG